VYVVLFLLFLFLGITNHIWLRANKISPFWDESRHLVTTIRYANAIPHSPNILKAIWGIDHPYPPLFFLASVPICLIWGNSLKVLAMSNLTFFAILIFSVYKTGEKLFNKKVGLLATFMTAMSPLVFGPSRMFLLEFASAAMIMPGIHLLIATEYFSNRKYSVLFGLSIGLGMLTRETFFIFLLGPTIYILYEAFSKPGAEKRKKTINLLISLVIGSILSLPYYLKNLSYYFMGDFREGFLSFWGRIICLREPFGWEGIVTMLFFLLIAILISRIHKFRARGYTKILVWFFIFILAGFCWSDKKVILKLTWYALNLKDQIGLPFLIVFLLCLPYFLRSGKNKGFLLSWIIVPYCFFTFPFFYDSFIRWQSRFTIPYLPAIALISASCILNIKNKISRTTIIYAILILGVIHFFNLSFGLPIKNDKVNRAIQILTEPKKGNWWLIHRPVKDNYWDVPEILKWIQGDMQKAQKENAVINLLVDTSEINPETFHYYILANRLPFSIFLGKKQLSMADYVISLSNPQSWHWAFQKDRILGFYDAFKEISGDFVLVKEFDKFYIFKKLDSTLYIYRNKSQ
jgi:4-amino-4-deoxy-L-arabinose transferase-like glycosyltransferase